MNNYQLINLLLIVVDYVNSIEDESHQQFYNRYKFVKISRLVNLIIGIDNFVVDMGSSLT